LPEVGIHRRGEVDLPDLLRRLRQGLGGEVGAVGCFIGIVRGVSKEGEAVRSLCYESSDEALGKLEEIAADIEKSPNISRVMIHHVIDELKPGEDAIYVLVAGRHRGDVFEALPKIMDRIKSEVPIWKKEITETKEYWVHEVE
jgi:molybdopterin synthase catalytic subunit